MLKNRRLGLVLLAVGSALAIGASAVARQDAPKPPAQTPPKPPAQEDLTNPITGSKPREKSEKPAAKPEQPASPATPAADKGSKNEGKADDAAPKQTQTITAGGLMFEVPSTWIVETPTKSMFTPAAQFKLPAGKTGATEDANVKVFTGIKGGVGPNIERWKAQIQNPDKPAEEKDLKVNGMDVHVLHTGKGGFNAGMGMQGGGSVKQDYMILGAIAVTDEGDVQFKATGPAAILEAEKPAWEAMVKSIRAAK